MRTIIISFLILLTATFHLKAQTDTFSLINFPINTYVNKITNCLFTSNARSGFVFESNGSVNMGMTGSFAPVFKFRWLAHDAGAINYGTDVDQLMTLDGKASLYVKNAIGIGAANNGDNYKLLVEGTIGARKVKVT